MIILSKTKRFTKQELTKQKCLLSRPSICLLGMTKMIKDC